MVKFTLDLRIYTKVLSSWSLFQSYVNLLTKFSEMFVRILKSTHLSKQWLHLYIDKISSVFTSTHQSQSITNNTNVSCVKSGEKSGSGNSVGDQRGDVIKKKKSPVPKTQQRCPDCYHVSQLITTPPGHCSYVHQFLVCSFDCR